MCSLSEPHTHAHGEHDCNGDPTAADRAYRSHGIYADDLALR